MPLQFFKISWADKNDFYLYVALTTCIDDSRFVNSNVINLLTYVLKRLLTKLFKLYSFTYKELQNSNHEMYTRGNLLSYNVVIFEDSVFQF